MMLFLSNVWIPEKPSLDTIVLGKNAIVENCIQKVRSCVLAASCNIEKGNHNLDLNGFHTIGGIGWICGKGKLSTKSIGPCMH